jgi:fucose permease
VTMKRSARLLLIGIAYAGFVAIGLSGGLLGVAWPSMRGTFDLSLDAVGSLMIMSTVGSLLSSFSSGPVVSRTGTGTFFMVSSLLVAVGLLGYSVAPAWWLLLLCGLLVGMGAGAIDAGLNTYFAQNHSASLMNWLHASYGLGAAIGPALMTAILEAELSWRWGYGAAGILLALLAAGFGLTLNRWRGSAQAMEAEPGSPVGRMRVADTWRMPVVWLSVGLFFTYAGIEASAGQWPYSLFTEARSVAASAAGLWISVYWGSLTVGRLVFGIVVERLGVVRLLRLSMLGVVCGAALVWWNVAELLGFLGLAWMGLSLAPVFPLLVSSTPKRVGAAHAPNAIGFQVGAAGLGIGALPALAGVLAESLGLEVVGPFLLLAAVAMLLLHEVLLWIKEPRA